YWPLPPPYESLAFPYTTLFRSIDTCELPVDKLQPRQRRVSTIQGASTLPNRVRELNPIRILIVKKTVFKPARQSLIEAGLGDRKSAEHTSELHSRKHVVSPSQR